MDSNQNEPQGNFFEPLPELPSYQIIKSDLYGNIVIAVDGLCIACLFKLEDLQHVREDLKAHMKEKHCPSGAIVVFHQIAMWIDESTRDDLANEHMGLHMSFEPNLFDEAFLYMKTYWKNVKWAHGILN